jgi:hypothetical protein
MKQNVIGKTRSTLGDRLVIYTILLYTFPDLVFPVLL